MFDCYDTLITPEEVADMLGYVAVENVKVLGKVATGELTLREGFEKMQETTVSTVAGLASMGKGAAIGGAVGLAFGPVGAAVGGFVGGTVAYMAGSKVGELAVKGARKVFDCLLYTSLYRGKTALSADLMRQKTKMCRKNSLFFLHMDTNICTN